MVPQRTRDEQVCIHPACYNPQEGYRASWHATCFCSRATCHLSLLVCVQGLSNRALQKRFQCSGDTIMRWVSWFITQAFIEHVFRCIYHLLHMLTSEEVYCMFVRLPTHDAPIPSKIKASTQFSCYFGGCIGALDGTHIPAHVPKSHCTAYCNRKNQLSQNVLAACDFNLKFIYSQLSCTAYPLLHNISQCIALSCNQLGVC